MFDPGPDSPPIRLSIAGAGRVLILDRYSIRLVIEAIADHNSGMKRLAGRLSFPWIADPWTGEPTWQRLKDRVHVSENELRRLEQQLNAILIREQLALTPRAAEVVRSFVPSRGKHGSRRIQFLPWNGLALELRNIPPMQLLQAPSAIVATRRLDFGGFHVWRYHGVHLDGPRSERTLTVSLDDFYDGSRNWKLSLAEFSKRIWFLVEQIGTLPGFRIVEEPLVDRTVSTARQANRQNKMPRQRRK